MAIKFDITGDNSNFLGALQGAENGVRNTAKTVEAAGGDIEGMFKRISQAAAGMFASFSAGQIVKTVVQTRGEFQQLEVAFQTMLGSAEKATTMVRNLQVLAATTPFDMKGVSEGAKQLLAYGVAADDIVDTMRRLGDVAAGLSLPLTDLAWLYGTTLTQGRMSTMDLRQFQARGIPMAEELAKIFGVTKNEVAGLVTAGKVTSKEVVAAIKSMTDEGSKFGGLMEAQSHTITGQISNIEDTISMMFNDVGKQSEGVINDALADVSTLVDHWQEVAKVVGTVVVSYGLYKGVLMTTIALEKARAKLNYNKQVEILNKEIAATRALIPAKQSEKDADLAAMVAKKQLTQAQAKEIAMKRQELAVTKQQVEAAKQQSAAEKMGAGLDDQIAALQELGSTTQVVIDKDLQEAVASNTITQAQAQEIQGKRELLAQLTQEAQARVNNLNTKAYEARMNLQNAQANQAEAQSALDAAQQRLEAARDAMDAAIQSGDADAQAAARTELSNAVNEVYTTQQNLKTAATEVATAETAANTAVEAANTAQTEFNTTMNTANAASKGTVTTATTASTTATTANTVAMRLAAIQTQAATIAQGIFAAAVNSVKMAWEGLKVAMATNPIGLILTGLTMAISLFTSFVDTTDKATEASKRFGEDAQKEIGNVNVLVSTMENISSTTNTYHNAMDQLNDELEKYNLGLVDENTSTAELIKKKEELIEKINEERDARVKANAIDTMNENYNSQVEEADKKFLEALKEAEHIDKAGFAYWDSDDIQNIADSLKEILNAKIKSEIPDIMKLDGDARQKAIDNLRQELTKIMTDAGVSEYDASFVKGSWNWADGVWNDALYEQINRLMEISEYWEENTGKVKDYNDEVEKTSPTITEEFGQSEDTMKKFFDEMEREMILGEADASSYNGMLSALVPDDLDPMGAFDKLHTLEDVTKQKIDEINSRKIMTSVDYTNLYGLNNFLIEIQNRLNNIISGTGGATPKNDLNTIDGINAELKSVNEELGKTQIGSKEYNDLVKYRDNLKKKIPDNASYHKPKTKNTEADRAAARAETTRDENERWAEEQRKQAREAQYAIEEAEIAAIRNSAERERRERELQHRKNLDQLDDQEREFRKANYEHNKKIFENSGKDKKNNFTGTIGSTPLTKDQQAQLDAQRRQEEAEWAQYRKEQEKANLQSLYDYYKQYGSFEQKRLAITEEYAQKIADAENEGQKKSLEKERDQKLSSLSYESISNGIDWSSLFSGLGSMSIDMMKQMQKKLQAYINTDDFKNADSQTQRDVTELLQEMRQYIGTEPNTTFQTLATDLQNFTTAITTLENARNAESLAVQQRDQAKKDLDAGKITEEEYKRLAQAAQDAGDATAKAQDDVENFGNKLNRTSDEVTHYTSGLTTALTNLKGWNGNEGFSDVQNAVGDLDSFKGNLDNALSTMGDGMAKTIGAKISTTLGSALNNIGGGISNILGSGMGQIVGFVAQIPKLILQLASAIKNFVTGILDSFTELFKLRWIDDLVNSILEAISNLIDAIFDLPENLFHVIEAIVVKGVGGLLNTVVGRIGNILTFGAASSAGPASWFTNSNAEHVAKTTEKLTTANEALTKAVDDLKNSIDNSGGKSAVEDYQQAYKDQEAINKNTMDILRAQMGYHSSHHSNAYYWNLNSSDYDAINQTLAQYAAQNPTTKTNRNSVYSLSDIYELTPEQMKAISSHNVEIWQKMLDAGKYDKSEYWKNYIELAGQLEDLTEKINENLTQISFDTMKSNFVSDIMDMEKTASDFSNDFTEMIAKAWTNAAVNDLMSDDLKKFYEQWADKMKNGTLTKDDVDALKDEYENLIGQALNIRDTMSEITGYTGETTEEQNASANGVSEITYDQANTFIGLVTAGNIVRQNISDSLVSAVATITSMGVIVGSSNGTLSEIRNLMIYNNSYLEDILKFEKNIYNDFSEKIDQTNRYLKDMK